MSTTKTPQIDEIKIDGRIYVPKDSLVTSPKYTGDIKIVVLQRGWIYVGRFQRDGNDCKLFNSFNIGVWGTTKGLPELVDGILPSTKLYPCPGIVEFDWLTVINTIIVNQEKWKSLIG